MGLCSVLLAEMQSRVKMNMISVIIPVFNCKNYIHRVYGCVASQTYKDWELIFVDDGSIDGSDAVCDSISSGDCRVHVVHQRNEGASVARRVGIENANGEYFAFIDCDDIVEADYLGKLWSCLNICGDDSVKLAACDMVAHDENVVPEIDRDKSVLMLDEDELQSRFFHYQFWGFWGKIYHKSVFDGVYFPKYTINEDYVVMAQIFHRYKTMAYLPVALYHYMNHGEGLSHQRLSKRMFDEYYNKLWVRDFYAKNNPRWLRCAEAQLAETCVKLLRCVMKNDEKGLYINEMHMIKKYLREHIVAILANGCLKMGVRVLALSLLV